LRVFGQFELVVFHIVRFSNLIAILGKKMIALLWALKKLDIGYVKICIFAQTIKQILLL
jgi:hypothetical protein